MAKKVGLGFLAFMCGTMSLAGISSFFRDLTTNPGIAVSEFIMAILFGAATIFIILKMFSRRIRIIPESRKFSRGSKLPIVPNAGLVLMPGEVCHIAEKAQIGKLKTVIGSVQRSSGTRVHGVFGVTSYRGSSRSRETNEDIIDKSSGMLYVTNRRIVMAAPKYGFEEPLEAVTAVTPYANSFDIQMRHNNYTVFVREPAYLSSVLQAAVSMKIRAINR